MAAYDNAKVRGASGQVPPWRPHPNLARLDSRPRDSSLVKTDAGDTRPGLSRTKLFMPGSLAYSGRNLWVGEFEFSTRILRFSPR